MIIPTACVFRYDGRTWFAVECYTEQRRCYGEDGPYMTWQLFDDKNQQRGSGYLYKSARWNAGINAAKRSAKFAAKRDRKEARRMNLRQEGLLTLLGQEYVDAKTLSKKYQKMYGLKKWQVVSFVESCFSLYKKNKVEIVFGQRGNADFKCSLGYIQKIRLSQESN